MKTITLARIFSTFAVGLALLACPSRSHASSQAAEVMPVGDNTFSVTRTAKSAFSRDTEKLKAEVEEDAAKYCADQGKQLKVVSLSVKKPFFSTGYASATLVFKALTAVEIEQASATSAAASPSERPGNTGDMYNDLMKLDDLRKKGILTDDEFQSEKKKILARSK